MTPAAFHPIGLVDIAVVVACVTAPGRRLSMKSFPSCPLIASAAARVRLTVTEMSSTHAASGDRTLWRATGLNLNPPVGPVKEPVHGRG